MRTLLFATVLLIYPIHSQRIAWSAEPPPELISAWECGPFTYRALTPFGTSAVGLLRNLYDDYVDTRSIAGRYASGGGTTIDPISNFRDNLIDVCYLEPGGLVAAGTQYMWAFRGGGRTQSPMRIGRWPIAVALYEPGKVIIALRSPSSVGDFVHFAIWNISTDSWISWGPTIPLSGGLGDIAVSPNGDVWFMDSNNVLFVRMSHAGVVLNQFRPLGDGPGQFRSPTGIACDEAGNVYATDYIHDRVVKLSPNGDYVSHWGGVFPGQPSQPLYMQDPTSITCLPGGVVAISAIALNVGGANHAVVKFFQTAPAPVSGRKSSWTELKRRFAPERDSE